MKNHFHLYRLEEFQLILEVIQNAEKNNFREYRLMQKIV